MKSRRTMTGDSQERATLPQPNSHELNESRDLGDPRDPDARTVWRSRPPTLPRHPFARPRSDAPQVRTGTATAAAPARSARRTDQAADRSTQQYDSEDEEVVLHSTTLSFRDPVENRLAELAVQESWLLRSLSERAWVAGRSLGQQTVLGAMMNQKMAANPCPANSAIRQAAVEHLVDELFKVEREVATLMAPSPVQADRASSD